ncbi:MAG: hypothetical protein J0647_05875 [Campylobacteraceae bacterium]|nr:hypothetical protein [Campylobacteraceae bacterium]
MKNLTLTTCIFCDSTKLYCVSKTQWQCATCKRKFSHKKFLQDILVLNYFIDNISAKECSEHLKLNYITIQKIYTKARILIIGYIEKFYLNQEKNFSQYDEYYFLPANKRGNIKYLFDAIGILGMSYGDFIYTLLLPDQFSHLKKFSLDNVDAQMYKEEYSKYLSQHKVAHYETFENRLGQFWDSLEIFMLHFKGVSKIKFIYYLKEAEFKFNHTKKEQQSILWQLWKENM